MACPRTLRGGCRAAKISTYERADCFCDGGINESIYRLDVCEQNKSREVTGSRLPATIRKDRVVYGLAFLSSVSGHEVILKVLLLFIIMAGICMEWNTSSCRQSFNVTTGEIIRVLFLLPAT